MKAIVYRKYGSPDVLQLEDVDQPSAGDSEVLIRIRAASVNPLDWHFMRGMPYLLRLMAGLRRPKVTRLGVDVAGQVEAVGCKVTQFRPGDAVFGSGRGAFAEYLSTAESAVVSKPPNLTFEQAAAAPVAALSAWQALHNKGHIQPGQKVLINGAAGGVGTFAVQIARSAGAEVTGVCSTRNAYLVRSLGASRVIDYTREDFTTSGQRYDLILDAIGNHTLRACRRVLAPRGTYVVVGAPGGGLFGPLVLILKAHLLSRFVSQNFVMFLTKPNQADLNLVRGLMESGEVVPVIDRCYPLSEVPQAVRYLEEGHARGKVVITI